MKAVVQRVRRARVLVDEEVVGEMGRGMVVLLGVLAGDGEGEARRLAERVGRFRFFEDERGRMNRDATDAGAAALVVSQFTLAADGRKGRRPSFDRAAPPADAEPLYERFIDALEELGIPTARGRFGARMLVEIEGDGPVTFVLDEEPRPRAAAARDAPPGPAPRS